jgi:hypothetical protein
MYSRPGLLSARQTPEGGRFAAAADLGPDPLTRISIAPNP